MLNLSSFNTHPPIPSKIKQALDNKERGNPDKLILQENQYTIRRKLANPAPKISFFHQPTLNPDGKSG